MERFLWMLLSGVAAGEAPMEAATEAVEAAAAAAEAAAEAAVEAAAEAAVEVAAEAAESEAWELENVSGFTMATTAALKNRLDIVKTICFMMVDETMTEEQMRPNFERVLKGQDLYGNTVMHYFALRKNDVAIGELLRLGGCMCIRNYAGQNHGQNAIEVRKKEELHIVVFNPSATPTMRIESVGDVAQSARCEECES